MTKIARNDSISIIVLSELGLEIQVGESYNLTIDEYLRWADSEAITELSFYINSGDLVINDGTNDLSASDGIRFLEYADRAYIQKDDVDVARVNTILNFEGDVTATNNGSGKTTITVGQTGTASGKLVDFFFIATGNSANKWLGVGNGSTSSNTLPYVVPWDCSLINLTFSNQDDNVDTNIKIYKNGVHTYTWNVRNKRTAWIANETLATFNQGDRVSCFLEKYTGGTGDSTAQDPIVEIILAVSTANIGEGGIQNGV